MKYSYSIVYDIEKDIWNWFDAINAPFEGFDFSWIDNIDNDNDRKIANQILGKTKQEADDILKPYLLEQKNNVNSKLNNFIKIIEKDFKDKYTGACKALEDITQHPMMSEKFIFCITTFPRMQYFYDERLITVYNSTEGVWGMPIDGFLHEGLHFQFTYYWRDNEDSRVSKLSEDNFHYLKEALTIVLDEDLKPLITVPDKGYSSQADFCGILHNHWQKHYNFEKLVEFGLDKLDIYNKA